MNFSHILLCNILTTILRPNFEKPLDTANQLVEHKFTLYLWPEAQIWKQFLIQSSLTDYSKLGEKMIVSNDWDQYFNITEHNVIGAGTHALMTPYLEWWELSLGRWHRSEERVSGHIPYGGYLTNKKWHLNEVG